VRPEQRLELDQQQGVQNPWRLARGKRFPAWFPHVRQGEVYPAGRHRAMTAPLEGKSRKQTAAGGRAAGCPGGAVGSVQGFS
jgi:hypothetical protein